LLATLPEGTFRLQMEREFAKVVMLTPEELAQMLAAMPESRFDASPESRSHGAEPLVANHVAPTGHQEFFDDEPPGFMDASHFGGDMDGYIPDEMDFSSGEPPQFSAAPSYAQSDKKKWRNKRQAQEPLGIAPKTRAVTPIAKRLLRLLLAHPELVDRLGDQQLEILHGGPHLSLVRDLIALIHDSTARHAGALLQAAHPDSDLAHVLKPLVGELMDQEELPDPEAEWSDALKRIELDSVKQEQSALIAAGLRDDESRKRYQELTRRIALLK
jgi:DNA primase